MVIVTETVSVSKCHRWATFWCSLPLLLLLVLALGLAD